MVSEVLQISLRMIRSSGQALQSCRNWECGRPAG